MRRPNSNSTIVDGALAVALAVLAGLMAAVLPSALLALVLAGAAFVAVVMLLRLRQPESEREPNAFLTGLVVIAVLTASWTNVRGPAGVPVSDLFLLMALIPIGLAALRGALILPLPTWLLCAAGGLVVAALVAELFVPDPPPRPLPADVAQIRAETVERDSDFAGFARLELALLVTPIVVGAIASSWRRARMLADVWMASAVICGGVAVADKFLGLGIGDRLAGVDWGTRELGLTSHPNQLGLACAMALPVGLARIGSTRGLARLVVFGSLGALLLGVLVSGSRLALIATALAFLLSFLIFSHLRPKLIAAAGVSLFAVFLAGSLLPTGDFVSIERVSGDAGANAATQDRFSRVTDSLEVVADYPLTGVGFATVVDAHSLPVQFLQAGGIIALLSFGIFVLGATRLGWWLTRGPPGLPEGGRQLSAALTAATGVWLLCGLVNPQVTERYLYVPLGILLGLGVVARAYGSSPWSARAQDGRVDQQRDEPRRAEDTASPRPRVLA